MTNLSFLHIITLALIIAIGFILPSSNFAQYDLEISALLFIFFYLSKHLFLKKYLESGLFRLIESSVLTLVVLLVVNTTGKTGSPFFFLIYFLLFSLSLLESAFVSLIASLILIVFYLFSLPQTPEFKNLIPIFSLAFISPFSVYLGKEYLENQILRRKLILEEEDFLLFLSLKLKTILKKSLELLENNPSEREISRVKKELKHGIKLIEKYESQF